MIESPNGQREPLQLGERRSVGIPDLLVKIGMLVVEIDTLRQAVDDLERENRTLREQLRPAEEAPVP